MKQIRVRGLPLYVHDDNESLSAAIIRNGDFWEGDILDYIRDNFPDQNVILDVGANIGNHTVYFGHYLNYRKIIAYEPDIDNWNILFENVKRFDRDKVSISHSGISDKAEWITFVANTINRGAGELHPEADGQRVYVETIDSQSRWYHPVTLMKIDVEWWEPKVLAGAQETLKRDHPLVLVEDVKQEYEKYFPEGYKIHKAWEHHNTYLYKWED